MEIIHPAEDAPSKPKLSVSDQIAHMKSKGVKFTLVSEGEAAAYLEENTYFFKLKAYQKLYDKYSNTDDPDKLGKYIDLEFAYLKDLAAIDAILRKTILQMALDIEHYLKVALIRDFNASDEDGYKIVVDFLKMNPEHYAAEFQQKRFGKACSNLVQKYEGHFAIWNIIEVLSFSDFHELYRFFYSRNGARLYPNNAKKQKGPYTFLMNPVRILRNAAAHNNCLLNSLKTPYVSPEDFNCNPEVSAFMGRHGMKNRALNTNMSKPFVHDFCVMLYLYDRVASAPAKRHQFAELKDLFGGRFARNGAYYQNKNTTLVAAYEFAVKVIDMYYNLAWPPKENS